MAERNRITQALRDRFDKWRARHADVSPSPRSPEERRLYELFYQSFRFSQGKPKLQRDMLYWLSFNNYFEGLSIPQRTLPSLLDVTPPIRHAVTRKRKLRAEADRMYGYMYEASKAPEKYEGSNPLTYIIESMVQREADFQIRGRPGRNKEGTYKTDSAKDPYASFLRKYVFMQHPTGTDAFDHLMQELRSEYLNILSIGNGTRAKLRAIEKRWESNHPEESFFTPQVKAEVAAITAERRAQLGIESDDIDEPTLQQRVDERQIYPLKQTKKEGK